MGSLEKLVKAFESLKVFESGTGPEELLTLVLVLLIILLR